MSVSKLSLHISFTLMVIFSPIFPSLFQLLIGSQLPLEKLEVFIFDIKCLSSAFVLFPTPIGLVNSERCW
ncbi:hypothetical protein F4703DRAFT_1819386 [Phycomyces blakesleeanus]